MLPEPQNLYSIQAKLERFEERFAVLQNETFGEFRWPIKLLPEDIQIGESIIIKASAAKSEEKNKYAKMRKLLEELIN